MAKRTRPVTRRDPRDVPGFERAAELGLLPQVPPSPPEPVAPNSRHLLLASVGAATAGVLTVLVAAGPLDAPGWALGLLSAAVVGVVGAVLLMIRGAQWKELQAGYCRLDHMVASFARDHEVRFPASGMRGAPWDLQGLWRLDDAGSVQRAPVPHVLPPGHYPSPNRPGELELWTGEVWAYLYRQPRTSFLPTEDELTP
ncbi:hypothetical protein [Nocardioides sp. AX2bis]|uniref:hypothetical protein n=1 Tax=Nocardioides sp. AX2bis TaxID=2653157 RepID=UPI0012F3F818|nr:hypothetical protein [Nocardioides sp. AX2bis]VXC29108.1 conserved hypothetical protein [Nocardioides sp. AX2bis]